MAAVAAVAIAHASTAAATADTVTLSQDGFSGVKVINRAVPSAGVGTFDLFVVVGASSPTVGIAESFVVPAGTSRYIATSGYTPGTGGTQPTNAVVSLISTSITAYTVEGVTR